MMVNDIAQWLVMLAIPVTIFAGRHWLQKRIESSVQHGFDKKLAALRSEYTAAEEGLKSELRAREAQIAALRDGVLSGRLHRQNLLDERRLQAAERIWSAVVDLQKHKNSAATMAVLKDFHTLARRAANDPALQRFFGAIQATEIVPANSAAQERPFASPLAWALLAAYHAIIAIACTQIHVLKIGMADTEGLFDEKKIQEVVIAALPDLEVHIKTLQLGEFYWYLDVIETRLLVELAKMVEGTESDQKSLEKSQAIMTAIEQMHVAQAPNMAEARRLGIVEPGRG